MVSLDCDIGDVVKVRFGVDMPRILREELSIWKKDIGNPDLTVESGKIPELGIPLGEGFYVSRGSYQMRNERATYSIHSDRIVIDGTPAHDFFRGRVLQPAFNRFLVPKGWCTAHASGVAFDGKTVVFPAFGGTGKTGLMLEFMIDGADFVADDHVLLGSDGAIAVYPRWIHLLEYNFRMFPELFDRAFPSGEERKRAERRLRRYRTGLEMRGSNALSRIIKRNLISRYYFECRLPPADLFPGAKVQRMGKVTHAFLLLRREGRKLIEDSTAEELARMASASGWINENAWIYNTVAELSGLQHHSLEDRRRILERFFRHAECFEVSVGESYDRKGLDGIYREIRSYIS